MMTRQGKLFLFKKFSLAENKEDKGEIMSSLKMYNFNPQPRGLTLPEGFKITKYKNESEISEWVDICKDGLISAENGEKIFRRELQELEGPDPYRDTYFIETESGEKIATITVVPDMWNTGMGYIHMVACKDEYKGRGLGKFMADFALQKFVEMDKKKTFLLTGDSRLAALSTYIKAGYLPVNYIDNEGLDMMDRWQKIVNALKLESIQILDNEGNPFTVLHCES